MDISAQVVDGVLLISVKGAVPENAMESFDEHVSSRARSALEAGRCVVFDLSACDRFHGAFRPLAYLRKGARERCQIALAALQPQVLEKCMIARINMLVPIYETVQQAIAAATTEPVLWHTTCGFAFNTPLSLKELKSRLGDVSGTEWANGDSHYHGDYLGSRITPEAVVRIFEVNAGYIANLHFYSKAPDAASQWLWAKWRFVHSILPGIGCWNATPCEPLE